MKRFHASRLVLLAACLAAMVTGALIAAERSASAMADAATEFLGSLTPSSGSRRCSRSSPRNVCTGTSSRPRPSRATD